MMLAPNNSQNKEDVFVLIEASKLSIYDVFMQHKPSNFREENLKEELVFVCMGLLRESFNEYTPYFLDECKNNNLKGIRCRWFTSTNKLQEAVWNTKDLIKIQ